MIYSIKDLKTHYENKEKLPRDKFEYKLKTILGDIVLRNIKNTTWQFIHNEKYIKHISGFDTEEIKEIFSYIDDNIYFYIGSTKQSLCLYLDDVNDINLTKYIQNDEFNPKIFKLLEINYSYSTEFIIREYKNYKLFKEKYSQLFNNAGFTEEQLERLLVLK